MLLDELAAQKKGNYENNVLFFEDLARIFRRLLMAHKPRHFSVVRNSLLTEREGRSEE